MPEAKPVTSASEAALSLIEATRKALAEAAASSKPGSGGQETERFFEAAESAGSLNLLFASILGHPYGPVAGTFIIFLAKHLVPDSKTIRRIEAHLKVLEEAPLRTGLTVFQRALSRFVEFPRKKESAYLESRFRFAQECLDEALEILAGEKVRKLLSEKEWRESKLRVSLINALCASCRKGGYADAQDLSCEPLQCLLAEAESYGELAAKHRSEWEELTRKLERMNATSPSSELISEYQAKLEFYGPPRQKHGALGPPDPDESVGLYLQVKTELEADIAKEEELATLWQAQAKQLKVTIRLVELALKAFNREE